MENIGLVFASLVGVIGVIGLLMFIIGFLGVLYNRMPENKNKGSGYDGFYAFLLAGAGFVLCGIGIIGWIALIK